MESMFPPNIFHTFFKWNGIFQGRPMACHGIPDAQPRGLEKDSRKCCLVVVSSVSCVAQYWLRLVVRG